MIWPVVQLSALADITMGRSSSDASHNDAGEGLPYFHNMAEFAKTPPPITKWCSVPSSTATEGDILLSVREPFGKVHTSSVHCSIGGGLAALRSKTDLIEQAYLALFLRYVEPILSRRGRVASKIRRPEIAELEVPLPPISEQHRIIEVLNQFDMLQHRCAVVNEKIEAVIPSLFTKMFGRHLRTGKSTRLGETLASFHDGSEPRSADDGDGGFGTSNALAHRVSSADVGSVPGSRKFSRWQPLEFGDILIARDKFYGDFAGQATMVEKPFAESLAYKVNQHIQRGGVIHVRVDRNIVHPWFLQTYLSLPEGRGALRAICRQFGISSPIDRDAFLAIPVPDISIERQKEFCTHARSTRALLARIARFSKDLSYASSSLLHRACTGDLTAQWRQSRTDSLLREAREQAVALQTVADTISIASDGKRPGGTDLC